MIRKWVDNLSNYLSKEVIQIAKRHMKIFSALPIIFVVQPLSQVQIFETPWSAACQVPLSFTISNGSDSCPLSWGHCLNVSSPAAFSFSLKFSQH